MKIQDVDCPRCQGTGQVDRFTCGGCFGLGTIESWVREPGD